MLGEEDPDFFGPVFFPVNSNFFRIDQEFILGMDLKISKEDKESSSPC